MSRFKNSFQYLWRGFFVLLFLGDGSEAAEVIITEVGACSPGDSEWIEILNISDRDIAISDLFLQEGGTDHKIEGEEILWAGESGIIVDKEEEFLSRYSYNGKIWDSAWSSLSNSGETLALVDQYGEGEVVSYPGCKKNFSLVRSSPINWDSVAETSEIGFFIGSIEEFKEAQPKPKEIEYSVQINEIQPFNVGDDKEWIELKISGKVGTEIDLTHWILSNGSSTKKGDSLASKFKAGNGLTLNYPIVTLDSTKGYLILDQSPISLTDGGGFIELREKGLLLDSGSYPDGKKGKTKDYAYSEVFVRERGAFFPFLYRENQGTHFAHTKGRKNQSIPTLPSHYGTVISEIHWGEQKDFVEVVIESDKFDRIDLQYWGLKLNGSSIFWQEKPWEVENGDRIVFWFEGEKSEPEYREEAWHINIERKSITATSGVLEVFSYQGTSRESLHDFFCFDSGKGISSTNEKRRISAEKKNAWLGACIWTAYLPKTSSIAQQSLGEDQERFGWEYPPSPGIENHQTEPHSRAIIQIENAPENRRFWLPDEEIEVSATLSQDSFGGNNVSFFLWILNGDIIGSEAIPPKLQLYKPGVYQLQLFVMDEYNSKSLAQRNILIGTEDDVHFERAEESFFARKAYRHKWGDLLLESEEDFFDDFIDSITEEKWEQYFDQAWEDRLEINEKEENQETVEMSPEFLEENILQY